MSRLVRVLILIGLGWAGTTVAGEPNPLSAIPTDEAAMGSVSVQKAVYRIQGEDLAPVWSSPVSLRGALALDEGRDRGELSELIHADARLSVLSALIHSSGLSWPPEPWSGVTVLAPTDQAFGDLPVATISRLAHDPIALENFLLGHSIAGVLDRPALEARAAVLSLAHEPIEIVDGERLRIGAVSTVQASLVGRNGVIHLIDQALTYTP